MSQVPLYMWQPLSRPCKAKCTPANTRSAAGDSMTTDLGTVHSQDHDHALRSLVNIHIPQQLLPNISDPAFAYDICADNTTRDLDMPGQKSTTCMA